MSYCRLSPSLLTFLAGLGIAGWTTCKAAQPPKASGSELPPVAQAFIGSASFEFEMTERESGRLLSQQRGTVYAGASGELRLDVELKPGQSPVICAIMGDCTWMVWADSSMSVEAPIPVPLSNDGWWNQLRAQSGQARAWCLMLLGAEWSTTPVAGSGKPKAGERTAGRAVVADVRVVAQPHSEAAEAVEVKYDDGSMIRVSDFRPVPGRADRPYLFEQFANDHRGIAIKQSWRICDYKDASDSAFTELFVAPSKARNLWPKLDSHSSIDARGRAEIFDWQSRPAGEWD